MSDSVDSWKEAWWEQRNIIGDVHLRLHKEKQRNVDVVRLVLFEDVVYELINDQRVEFKL